MKIISKQNKHIFLNAIWEERERRATLLMILSEEK